MAVPKSIHAAKGLWRGKSKLNQSWLPPGKRVSESNSSLHIDTDSLDTFATITYDWHYEGKREEGTIILAKQGKSNAVEIGWVDSWHEHDGVLHLKGEDSGTGSVKARGLWSAGKEVWGWTIELLATADSLTVKMENVPPAGEPIWAVEGVYSRD
ncbi:MAG: hypothetical protein HY248_03795 [Fimbriimonas ginsengisoli]|uniref:DUF1579 domain-containing protein n=1 Tax=Fimbriimonas ginsengisoli TaxID=1005039 RepID=A0A931LSF6_FIMGI|nr:hypothetical protein [Fimbriimonas ginsengisoli]MBI3721653.1 hypothetical protein [Fimbriimonas ginsengisoli]